MYANLRFTDDIGSTTCKSKVYKGESGVKTNAGYYSYSNFELHTLLFGKTNDFYHYYCKPKRVMIRDEDNQYGYHLSC